MLVSVFGQGHGVGLFIMPDYNQPLTVFFFSPHPNIEGDCGQAEELR